MRSAHLDPRFSDPTAAAPAWDDVEALLTAAELYWLTTVRTDGRPHVSPLVGVWHDDAFAFCTGEGEQKQINLDAGSAAAVCTGSNSWASGTDVVVEGTPIRTTGRETLEPLAAAWREKYGADWDWQADDEGFFDEGHGSRPWVYVVRPGKVIVFAKEPHAQTTFRF